MRHDIVDQLRVTLGIKLAVDDALGSCDGDAGNFLTQHLTGATDFSFDFLTCSLHDLAGFITSLVGDLFLDLRSTLFSCGKDFLSLLPGFLQLLGSFSVGLGLGFLARIGSRQSGAA